jgi:putative addiction module antidote
MTALKLRKVGNSVGLVFPSALLSRMRATVGDTVHVTETPGGVRLSPYDPVFEEQMALASRVMRKNRNVLRQLAK